MSGHARERSSDNCQILLNCHLGKYRKTVLDLLQKIKKFDSLIDVLVIGSSLPEEEVVTLIGKGATDCLEEPVSPDIFESSLLEIVRRRALRKYTLGPERQPGSPSYLMILNRIFRSLSLPIKKHNLSQIPAPASLLFIHLFYTITQ